jgi:hypothetical protein
MGEYSIGDAMKQFLNGSRIKGGIQALQIEDVWERPLPATQTNSRSSVTS